MKILFITSRLPYPPYRGDKLKIFNLIKQLSSAHKITLLSFIASQKELEQITFLQPYCDQIYTIHLPKWRSLFNCLKHIFSRTPFQVAWYESSQMHRTARNLIENHGFEIIHVHLIRMAQYAMKGGLAPRLLDLTDAGSLYLRRFLETTGNVAYKVLIKQELGRISRYEQTLEQFDCCLVCSSVDRDVLLQRAPSAKIELLFNGIDLDYFSMNGAQRQTDYRVICTGNMSYFPNADGVRYFVKEIFPAIKSEIPEAKFFVVGQDPPRKMLKLSNEDIIVTGFVQDIKEYYFQSTVAVAPIRFGAGTLNKILEPMALGIPVVATPVGVEGLPVQHGCHLLVARDSKEFSRSVIRLLRDKKLRENLASNAQQLVRSLYGWKVIAQQLEAFYRNLLSTCKPQ